MTSCGLEANQLKIKQPSTRLSYRLTASSPCEHQSKRNRIWQQHKYRGTCCTWSCMFKQMTRLATNARHWLTLLAAPKHSDLMGNKTWSSVTKPWDRWPYIGTQRNIRFREPRRRYEGIKVIPFKMNITTKHVFCNRSSICLWNLKISVLFILKQQYDVIFFSLRLSRSTPAVFHPWFFLYRCGPPFFCWLYTLSVWERHSNLSQLMKFTPQSLL